MIRCSCRTISFLFINDPDLFIVVLHVTDIPFLNAEAIVTRQRLESIGFKVILKTMDWSTNLVVRTRKEPPDKGGFRRRTSAIQRRHKDALA